MLFFLSCLHGPRRKPLDIPFETLIYALLAVYAAGVIKGLTGFGFSLLTVPVLVIIFDPRTAIPVIILLNSFTNAVLFIDCRKGADFRRITPLIIAGIVAIPLGMLLLLTFDAQVLKIIVGCVTVFFAVAFLVGFKRPVRNEKRGFAIAGLISGTLHGLISTGGPSVTLFLSNQGVAKTAFRANLITYFLFLGLASLPVYLAGGLLTFAVARYAVMLLPALFLGALTGSKLLHRIPEMAFRVTALIIVIFAGLLAMLSSLGLV